MLVGENERRDLGERAGILESEAAKKTEKMMSDIKKLKK